jgi:MarR family transcriptional regulator for hemolysin
MVRRPAQEPIGLELTRTAKVVQRAFDAALAAAGASLPVWLVLLSLTSRQHGAQRELAAALGIEGPTLTHHLNKMETAGLVTRRRDPVNRRVHIVELTDAGRTRFTELLETVQAFDTQLRAGFTRSEQSTLHELLARLRTNVEVSA